MSEQHSGGIREGALVLADGSVICPIWTTQHIKSFFTLFRVRHSICYSSNHFRGNLIFILFTLGF